MNHKLKLFVRSVANRNKNFLSIYQKMSRKRTEKNKSLSDEEFIKRKFVESTGYKLDLENPKTFDEKLQWLKLYDHQEIYTVMADKYKAREYISAKIGAEYTVPLYGVWETTKAIDFDSLPDKYVIKCNHNCGGLSICRNKETFDTAEARAKLDLALKTNYYDVGREWQYKNIKPVIIAEKLLENANGSPLIEYDFFCFNGEPRIVTVCWGDRDKDEIHYNDFYNMDFIKLDIQCNYPKSDKVFEKPERFNEMIDIARRLTGDRVFLRVDMYLCDNRIYIGELTFHHWGGMGVFNPTEWDREMGSWLDISKVTKRV